MNVLYLGLWPSHCSCCCQEFSWWLWRGRQFLWQFLKWEPFFFYFFVCFEIREQQGPPTDTARHVGPTDWGFVWGHQGSYWSHIQRGDLDRREEPGPDQDRRHLRSCGAGHERRAGERRRVCCRWGSDSCGFCRCQQSSNRRRQKEGQVWLMWWRWRAEAYGFHCLSIIVFMSRKRAIEDSNVFVCTIWWGAVYSLIFLMSMWDDPTEKLLLCWKAHYSHLCLKMFKQNVSFSFLL